ncbi:hypothetical protein [Methylobacterium sp. J-070]|uniref:hypothetical protein n=1 Tax=Methylobacterium sp. J-070 TaxID=2836650 RepID=UPI001FB9D0D4|nr:hypothetical protein [Methylobacterium sp. J-070]MCJ2050879.1 hypothetical protein [Methylobacterium sp. J-070]
MAEKVRNSGDSEGGSKARPIKRVALLHPNAAAHLMNSIHAAGLGKQFAALSKQKKINLTVHMTRGALAYRTNVSSLNAIHDFVSEKMPNNASVSSLWDCNPDDPYDLCWGAKK